MTGTLNEDELKHEVILEKVKTMAEDTPEEVAALLQALLTEEAEIPNTKEKG
jgi:flagellar M-ring protein FliF